MNLLLDKCDEKTRSTPARAAAAAAGAAGDALENAAKHVPVVRRRRSGGLRKVVMTA